MIATAPVGNDGLKNVRACKSAAHSEAGAVWATQGRLEEGTYELVCT
jgi:hypothetical protein